MKSVSQSAAGGVASAKKTKEPVTLNIADEVTEEKHVNGEQATIGVRKRKKCTKQNLANLIGGLVSWSLQCWLSQSSGIMTRVAVVVICSTLLIPFAGNYFKQYSTN